MEIFGTPIPKNMIDEDRFFPLIPAFFAHPEKVLVEIAQNASRAKATKLDISISGDSLTVHDNGQGTKDIKPLLCIADSKWDKDVEAQEMPAGWGNYYLISLSETVTYRSLFGSITIDCPMFLTNSSYREKVFSNIIPPVSPGKNEGFAIEAVLLPGVSKRLLPAIEGEWHFQEFYGKTLGYFPMEITVNGKRINRLSLLDNIKNCQIRTLYQGNHIGINISEEILESPKHLLMNITAVWYGVLVKNMPCSSVFLDVTKGSPITPVLPFRHDIKDDEKSSALYEFVRTEVIKYCITILNDLRFKDERLLLKASEILASHGLQDELDSLVRFCVVTTEPYYSTEYCGSSSRKIMTVHKRNPVIISEDVNLYVDGKEQSTDDLFLPEGVISVVIRPDKKPSWLSIVDKAYALRVTTNKNKNYSRFYRWEKCIIDFEGKDIKAFAVVSGAGDGTVYYSETPDKFYRISDAVFAQREYYAEGGDWDLQLYDFNREISEDIQNITGEYKARDLFKGISDVLGIWYSSIESLSFDRKEKTLVVKTDNGELVLRVS